MTSDVKSNTIIEHGFLPKYTIAGSNNVYPTIESAIQCLNDVQLDNNALNVFLRTGFFLNGKTPFKGISRYHPEPIIVEPVDINFQDACDTYIALFQQAVRRNLQEKSIITLSGGRDSRHILLELNRINRLPELAITVDMGEDTSVASMLCQRVGISHRILSYDPKNAARYEFDKNSLCNFSSLEHRWAYEIFLNRGTLPLWDGIGGDIMSNGLAPSKAKLEEVHNHFAQGTIDQLADFLTTNQNIPFFDDVSTLHPDNAKQELYEELLKHRNAANPVGSFLFWNRTRVQIGSLPFSMLRPTEEHITLAPYLEDELWYFLASIPAPMFFNGFHTKVISIAYPEFADIPYADDAIRKKPSMRPLRDETLSSIEYLLANRECWNLKALLRLLEPLIIKSRRADIRWKLPLFIYKSQLEKTTCN